MMKSVQSQKIHQTIELLFKYYHDKEHFMKENIPIQQQLTKKIEATAQLTLAVIANIGLVLKQEKQCIITLSEGLQKATLSNSQKFKLIDKKMPNQEFGPVDWNRNLSRVIEGMSNSHILKLNSMKNYHKLIDLSFQEISKEEIKYRSQLKHYLKQISSEFMNIDTNQKQQDKILYKLSKDSKSKELKQSLYFLGEVKKIEGFMYKQFEHFIERNKKLLELIKTIVKNERSSSKKVKQVLTNLFEKKKDLFKQSADDEKLIGLLSVMQDGVQQARELYLQKTLISKQLLNQLTKVVPVQKSKIHQMMKYLSLDKEQVEQKYSFVAQIRALSTNLSFKNFPGVSLAQGWLITTYTPAVAYLTFDHYLIIYDASGALLKKIHSSSTKVNKVNSENAVYLQQKKKGIFTDSVEQYQLKFDNSDRMEEFILFIENQIA